MTSTVLSDVVALRPDGDELVGEVPDGWDVQGTPHGGFLLALVANAALTGSGEPDVLSVTTHYLRRSSFGPVRFAVARVGGGRRLSSWSVTAMQEGRVTLSAVALLGDRGAVTGEDWSDHEPWEPDAAVLSPAAGSGPPGPFTPPAVAERVGLRLDTSSVAFATGATAERAEVRCVTDDGPQDQLTALLACDNTPPPIWNVAGAGGWMPTIELTAHVRSSRPVGPLRTVARTRHVTGGLLEVDALVHDARGTLVVQSRQLAMAPRG